MSRIAIIGAGLSGRLLALNLLRFASSNASVSVRMLDRGDERYMGPAYSYQAGAQPDEAGADPSGSRVSWRHALLNGAIIGQNGAASDVLYTLRSSMKGVVWEVLAVPEIRVQAERLARLLLDDDHRRRDAFFDSCSLGSWTL